MTEVIGYLVGATNSRNEVEDLKIIKEPTIHAAYLTYHDTYGHKLDDLVVVGKVRDDGNVTMDNFDVTLSSREESNNEENKTSEPTPLEYFNKARDFRREKIEKELFSSFPTKDLEELKVALMEFDKLNKNKRKYNEDSCDNIKDKLDYLKEFDNSISEFHKDLANFYQLLLNEDFHNGDFWAVGLKDDFHAGSIFLMNTATIINRKDKLEAIEVYKDFMSHIANIGNREIIAVPCYSKFSFEELTEKDFSVSLCSIIEKVFIYNVAAVITDLEEDTEENTKLVHQMYGKFLMDKDISLLEVADKVSEFQTSKSFWLPWRLIR